MKTIAQRLYIMIMLVAFYRLINFPFPFCLCLNNKAMPRIISNNSILSFKAIGDNFIVFPVFSASLMLT